MLVHADELLLKGRVKQLVPMPPQKPKQLAGAGQVREQRSLLRGAVYGRIPQKRSHQSLPMSGSENRFRGPDHSRRSLSIEKAGGEVIGALEESQRWPICAGTEAAPKRYPSLFSGTGAGCR